MTFDPTLLIAPGCLLLSAVCFGMAIRKLARSTEALARRLDEVAERVDRDPLTGVYNRGAGEFLMAQSLRAFPCVVAFVDVDDFRRVNKDKGWAEGDRLLRDLGERLGAAFLQQLRTLRSPHIKEIRGRGLLIGIELTSAARPFLPFLCAASSARLPAMRQRRCGPWLVSLSWEMPRRRAMCKGALTRGAES